MLLAESGSDNTGRGREALVEGPSRARMVGAGRDVRTGSGGQVAERSG